jgi:exopolyphosphatase/pppGpp-phosphohydrolase
LSDLPPLPPDQQSNLEAVLRLARTCEVDVSHTYQVTHLSVCLFEELHSLHSLGQIQRAWLIYAALLHDIGWIEGGPDHHRVSLRIILATPMLNFTNKERLIIGSIARYHRKSLPDLKHDHYAALSSNERHIVDVLSACLRLANALDHSHQQRVTGLQCLFKGHKIVVNCAASQPCPLEYADALEKCDLLARTFHRKVTIKGLV